MAAMFDLTELTGAHADRARTSTIAIWQVPAAWLWPSLWGMIAGLFLTLPLIPLAGPGILIATFLGAPISVALTVGGDEAPWKRAANKVRASDSVFLFCGRKLDMSPDVFHRPVPSAVAPDPPARG